MADEENKTKEVKEEVKQEAAAEAAPSAEAKEEPKAEAKAEAKAQAKEAKSEKVAVPKEFSSITDQLDKMSALEISKFVKFLEEYWGVSAAAPAVAVAAPAGGGDAAPAEQAKSEYDVILKDAGAQKVAVIKAVKDITNLGLGEAKAIVDSAPKAVVEKVKKDEAEAAQKTLEAAGATVELA